MWSDHGLAGYSNAFENLLAISVLERNVWLSMTSLRRSLVREYWYTFPTGNIFSAEYPIGPAVELMKLNSKYKIKAFRAGMIRPFLLFASMSPQRRAALASLMGMSLVGKYWYLLLDPHKEAWQMTKHLQKKANGIFREFSNFIYF